MLSFYNRLSRLKFCSKTLQVLVRDWTFSISCERDGYSLSSWNVLNVTESGKAETAEQNAFSGQQNTLPFDGFFLHEKRLLSLSLWDPISTIVSLSPCVLSLWLVLTVLPMKKSTELSAFPKKSKSVSESISTASTPARASARSCQMAKPVRDVEMRAKKLETSGHYVHDSESF